LKCKRKNGLIGCRKTLRFLNGKEQKIEHSFLQDKQKMTGKTQLFIMNITYAIARFTLCVIFFYAGVAKLGQPQNFAIIISDFRLLPQAAVMPIAILLPLLEVSAAIGLFFDVRGSLGTIFFLLLVFIAILSYAIWLELDVDCGCFGPEDPEFHAYNGLRLSLYRDVFLVACVFFLYIFRRLLSIRLIRPTELLTLQESHKA